MQYPRWTNINITVYVGKCEQAARWAGYKELGRVQRSKSLCTHLIALFFQTVVLGDGQRRRGDDEPQIVVLPRHGSTGENSTTRRCSSTRTTLRTFQTTLVCCPAAPDWRPVVVHVTGARVNPKSVKRIRRVTVRSGTDCSFIDTVLSSCYQRTVESINAEQTK